MKKIKEKKHNGIILLVLGTIILIALLFFIGYFTASENRYNSLATKQAIQNKIMKNKISKRRNQLLKDAYSQALSDPQSSAAQNVEQVKVSKDIEQKANSLFQILLSYRSSADFNSRAEKAAEFVTNAVLQDKEIFGSDLNDGTHYVDASGLNSVYISVKVSEGLIKNNKVSVLIKAKSSSWYSGQHRAIIDDLYIGEYDASIAKFTQIKPLDNLYRANADN